MTDSRTLTVEAARRLHTCSVILAVIVSLANAGGLALGFVVAIGAHTGKRAAAGGAIAGGAILAEVLVLVGCFACQAVARYIEVRVARPAA